MIYVYGAVLLLLIILTAASGNYKKQMFNGLDTREDPLKFLYSASARVYDIIHKVIPAHQQSNVKTILKQLHVSESVDDRVYVYNVRRYATFISILFAACMLGVLLCIKNPGPVTVTSLQRNEYGQGSRVYDLEADYEGTLSQIELEIDERKLTDEEKMRLLDEAEDPIRKIMMGENTSADHVDKPLDLITEYGNISISWEINDPDLVNYSGELTNELNPGESLLVNLKAELSVDDAHKILVIPVNITAASDGEQQMLIRNIMNAVAADGAAYDSSVDLPDEINGRKITFRTIASGSKTTIPILVLICAVVVMAGYERMLQDRLRKRNEQLMSDFAEIVFKLGLLFEAGMSIRGAWERILKDASESGAISTHFAFREMKLASEKINSGMSEAEAYGEFGRRCGIQKYIKFGNILQQNLSKGTKGMKEMLAKEAADAFEERKRIARKKGEEAGTKMLIPMVIMLVIVIVIVAVPALMSIGI